MPFAVCCWHAMLGWCRRL